MIELSQLRTFDTGAVNACGTQGNCCQCAMCCVAYRVIVPSVRGDVDSPTTVKQAGDLCPQFDIDTNGRATCVLHKKKDHPSLRICRNWQGNLSTDEGDMTHFEHLCRATATWITNPDEPAHVDRIVSLLEKNAIPLQAIEHAKLLAIVKPLQIVEQYVRCGTMPSTIMNLLEIPENLKRMNTAPEALAWQIGLHDNHLLYDAFMQVCCPWNDAL